MNIELLNLLSKNARTSEEDLATMLGISAEEVRSEIKDMEKKGYICGYKAVIDWDKLDDTSVSAIVDLNVVPKAGFGFEDVADKIASFAQVEAVYLMSGVYDLTVIVKGKTLQDVARFVARELAPMETVTSTSTHFVMRRYKELDVKLINADSDGRGQLFV
ncbi:MAG: Lrp/AsnC family transcriptional regulator [Clostridia bacterium]|nr:Lrp/AsnC family transcriptional regulator [Clostridia bacterium]